MIFTPLDNFVWPIEWTLQPPLKSPTPTASDDFFTCFNSMKGDSKERLSHLLDVRESRLAEPVDLPYFKKAVCDRLFVNYY